MAKPQRPSPDQSQDIAALAYSLWLARGCPEGSPEEDWFRAEEDLAQKAPSSGRRTKP
jgi:hypothetical protein